MGKWMKRLKSLQGRCGQGEAGLRPLTRAERRAIESWFDYLGEYQPGTRAEYLAAAELCAKNRADYLKWAADPAAYFGKKTNTTRRNRS